MDNVTHGLHGLALAAVAALDPAMASDAAAMSAVLWAASLGSQAPDFDFVIRIVRGNIAYLRHHRGISHSIPAWLIWPTLLALVLLPWHPGQFTRLWLWSFYGVLVHVGMDLLTTYGTVAFWPFYKRRIGLDVLMIVDLVLWAFGFLGIFFYFQGYTPRQILLYTLVPSLVYLLVRISILLYLRSKVKVLLDGRPIQRISVIPFVGLFRWNLVVELHDEFISGSAHLRKGIHLGDRFRKKSEAEVLRRAAERSEMYRVFQWFARHLFIETREREDGLLEIEMADLTYKFSDRLPYTVNILLDRNGKIISEQLGRKHVKTHDVT